MLAVAVALFHVVGFVSSIHAILSTRTSQGAIAWAVSLNTFPYLAVPAYWILGRNKFKGYVTARQEGDLEIQDIVRGAEATLRPFVSGAGDERAAARAAERLAEIPVLTGNHAELLIDGEATFASIFEGIDAARDYILVQFFIVKDDSLGGELKARLINKAKHGVRVYFMFDEIGATSSQRGTRTNCEPPAQRSATFIVAKARATASRSTFAITARSLSSTERRPGWAGIMSVTNISGRGRSSASGVIRM